MTAEAPQRPARLRLGLIGTGSMGANHARVIASSGDCVLEVVIDADLDRARGFAERYGCRVGGDIEAAAGCDAVVVATTTESHVSVAEPLLREGLPVLVEKPVAPDPAEVQRLVDLAAERDIPLQCGFVERFNPVVATAQSLLEEPPVHALAMRHSPVTPRARTSVVYDLLIHDIDLALRLFHGHDVVRVSGATSRAGRGIDEIADCTITFEGDRLATLSSSRASHRKIRSLHVSTASALFELDLLRSTIAVWQHVEHLRAADRAHAYRAQTVMDIPFVRHRGEPLALQLQHFAALVRGEGDAAAERDGMVAPHRVAAAICHPS